MSDRTEVLIDRLSREADPVRPLAPPHQRVALWLALALPVLALAVAAMGPRDDLAARLGEARFLIEQGAALATAITAAFAALVLATPGMDRRLALLPALPGAVWAGTLGLGCIADWMRAGADGLRLTPEPACLGYIVVIGIVPALVLVAMLRRGVPLAPRAMLFLAGLAAAGLANFGLRLFHDTDAALMVLVWQFGSVLVLSGAAALVGRAVLERG